MKKIYFLLGSVLFCGSVIAQSAYSNMPVTLKHKAKSFANMKAPLHSSSSTRATQAAGAFNLWIEPVGAVMTTLNTISDQANFLQPIFQDSTVTQSFPGSTASIATNYTGSILDPTSPNLQASFQPIVTKNDPYMIDSLQIVGSYVKKTAAVDTLYIWLAWGDSTNTSVFKKYSTGTLWLSPISTWRANVIGADVSGAIGAAGNKITCSAPIANKMLIKYVLKATDSVASAGTGKYISIALPSTVTVPKGNIVSCFYTFVPGGAYVTNDCSFSVSGAPTVQTINGFAGYVWGQNPQPTSASQYKNDQVDPNSWCMGTTFSNNQRHLKYPASYCNSMFGDPTTAPLISYHITGTSTLGVNNLSSNVASVSQNFPNPFSQTTSIVVTLTKTSDVNVKVYNTLGQLVLENNENNLSVGSHTIKMNAAQLASGLYFYTVKSGNYSVTHKMIVE